MASYKHVVEQVMPIGRSRPPERTDSQNNAFAEHAPGGERTLHYRHGEHSHHSATLYNTKQILGNTCDQKNCST